MYDEAAERSEGGKTILLRVPKTGGVRLYSLSVTEMDGKLSGSRGRKEDEGNPNRGLGRARLGGASLDCKT